MARRDVLELLPERHMVPFGLLARSDCVELRFSNTGPRIESIRQNFSTPCVALEPQMTATQLTYSPMLPFKLQPGTFSRDGKARNGHDDDSKCLERRRQRTVI